MSSTRISAIRKKIRSDSLDGMIIARLDRVRYLCGYTGSNGLLVITDRTAQFLTDFRYVDQAKQEVRGARVTIVDKGNLLTCLSELPQLGKKNLKFGYEDDHLSILMHKQLRETVPEILLVPSSGLVSDMGWVKDKQEIADIARAVEISETALERVLNLVMPGVRERELAAELEYQMMMLGSEKPAFDSIVASGYRSAMPHGEASDKKLKKGDFVTFDFGAVVNRYVSDMTRTVVVGKASPRQKKIYGIVLRAQKAGVRKIKAGVSGKAIDTACRNIITRAGFGKEFGHGTGHGIGVYHDPIHTGPSLGPRSEDILKVNQVVTVEPGIYVSGWGGVRIEDDVVVTRSGSRVLNKFPKNLLEL